MLDKKNNTYYKNYIFLLCEGILFDVGITFFNPSTILPLLISKLTGSSLLVGMLSMLRYLSPGLSSLITGNITRSHAFKKKFLLVFSAIGRLPIWILGILLIYCKSDSVILWGILVLLIQFMFWSGDGSIFSVWSDVLGKTIKADQRGRFFALRQFISGVLALIASVVIKNVLSLKYLSFPVNYGIVILIGAIVFTISVFMFMGIKEKPSLIADKDDFTGLIKKIPYYFKSSKPFLLSMLTLFFCSLSTVALPFYIIYSQANFNMNDGNVGIFIIVQVIGRMVGGVIYGFVGDKYGHEKSIMLYSLSTFIIPCLVIITGCFFTDLAFIFFSFAYFFIGIFIEGWAVFLNYMIDSISEKQRTLFAGLINIVKIPASIAPFIGGIIVHKFGYLPVFIAAMGFAFTGIYFAVKIPPAERTR